MAWVALGCAVKHVAALSVGGRLGGRPKTETPVAEVCGVDGNQRGMQ